MTYLPDTRASLARASRGGRAMGGTDVTSDPVAALIAQVNRFGPDAPAKYRYVTAPYPLATGTVPTNVAVTAAFLMMRRAQDALLAFNDSDSAALLAEAAKAQATPVAYVTTNLARVTQTIASLADSYGLPQSGGFSSMRILGVPVTTVAIGAAGLLAIGYLVRKGKRR